MSLRRALMLTALRGLNLDGLSRSLPAAPTSTVVEREFTLTGANVSAKGEVISGYEFEHDS